MGELCTGKTRSWQALGPTTKTRNRFDPGRKNCVSKPTKSKKIIQKHNVDMQKHQIQKKDIKKNVDMPPESITTCKANIINTTYMFEAQHQNHGQHTSKS